MRLAILDDYQDAGIGMADWGAVPGLEVVSFTDHVADEARLARRLAGFDAVMRIRERTPFPRSLLERLPDLRLLLATGMRNADSIDMAAARERGITVCGTEVHGLVTVELVWAMILNLLRRVPQEAASLRAGGWQVGLGRGLEGKVLGVIGLGRMGVPVARVGRAFGMTVRAWSPHLTAERCPPHGVELANKAGLFAESDVVTLHMPDSDATAGLIGAAEFAAMKRGAIFVNTSRPRLVDQAALLAALTAGRIRAGIDVYPQEPLAADDPFRSLPNVLATPHIGFVTEENYRLFFTQSCENIAAFAAGRPIRVIS